MRNKFVILVSKFVREDGSLEIGGIETYVQQLISAIGVDYEHYVFQPGLKNATHHVGETTVIVRNEGSLQKLTDYICGSFLSNKDILIVSTEQLGIKPQWRKTIVIQHGIYWDLPVDIYSKSKLSKLAPNFYKIFDNYRNVKRMSNFTNIVCVDHAYINWYSSIIGKKDCSKKFNVIVNHADASFHDIPVITSTEEKPVSVLFARRMMRFRGTLLFANVARKLLEKNPKVKVTICGTGPDEMEMKKILPPGEHVDYCVAKHSEMPQLIAQHDIVIVPSLGSEGTSLSAIEGMAAGRAVVASAVGGLPNVIIDGFNGALVFPDDEVALLACLQGLVNCGDLRVAMAARAKQVAKQSFGFEAWSQQWRQVVSDIK